MEENDWLHNLGAGVVTFVLMMSPIISVLAFKWSYDESGIATWAGMGYGFLGFISGILTGVTSIILYTFVKENLG